MSNSCCQQGETNQNHSNTPQPPEPASSERLPSVDEALEKLESLSIAHGIGGTAMLREDVSSLRKLDMRLSHDLAILFLLNYIRKA